MPMRSNQEIFKNDKSPKRTFTNEEVDEIKKCCYDVVYFAENYCIVKILGKSQKIKLLDYQKEILNNYKNNQFNIVQKTRQTGITTLNNIKILHYSIFNKSKTIAVFGSNGDVSKSIIDNFKQMYENLPEFLKPRCMTYNHFDILFDNNVRILSGIITENSLRGFNIDLMVLDEYAFVKYQDSIKFWNANFPCSLSVGGKIIISSNKNKENRKINEFWRLWCDAIDGKNEFKPYYINWDSVPNRDQNWRIYGIKTMGIEKFNNDYEVSYTYPNPLSHDQYGNKQYTPKEFAKLFNVSTSTVARWRTQGKINGIQVSERQFYYSENDIYMIQDINLKNNIERNSERNSERNIYKIDCGDLPKDIVQKYVNELRERFKNQ